MGCGERVFRCKITTENAKIWIFLKNVKSKGRFLSNSLDNALSHASRNVCIGNPTQSVQELWTIINSRVKNVACSGLKGYTEDEPFAREFVSEKPYSTKTYFVQQHCRAKIYKQNETSNIP